MEHVHNPEGLSYVEMVTQATTGHNKAPVVAEFEVYPVKKMREEKSNALMGAAADKRRNAAQEPEMVPDEPMSEADFGDSEPDSEVLEDWIVEDIDNYPELQHVKNAVCRGFSAIMVFRKFPFGNIKSRVSSNAQYEDPVEPSRRVHLCRVCQKITVMEGIKDCETCRSSGSDSIVAGGLLLTPRAPSLQPKRVPQRLCNQKLVLPPRVPSPMPDSERRSGSDNRAAGGVVRSPRTASQTPSVPTPTDARNCYSSGSDTEYSPNMPDSDSEHQRSGPDHRAAGRVVRGRRTPSPTFSPTFSPTSVAPSSTTKGGHNSSGSDTEYLPMPDPDSEKRRSGPDNRAAGRVARSRRTPLSTPSATTPTGGYNSSGFDPENPPMPQPSPKQFNSRIFTWGQCTLEQMGPRHARKDSLIALNAFGESDTGRHTDALILLDMEGYCRQYIVNELFNTQSDRQFHGP